jgi:hypothetical protein
MSTPGFGIAPQPEQSSEEAIAARERARLELEGRARSGAGWFYWIAGLSVINSVILMSGGEWSFIFGLGMTQIVDAVASGLGPTGVVLQFIINAFIVGVFVFFGYFARKHHKWAFLVGMGVYAVDGLIFVLAGDFLGVGFHVFALFLIFNGMKASDQLREQQQAVPAVVG